MIGMNLAGAEFGNGFRYGYDYIYPTAEELDHLHHEAHDQCFIANSVKTAVRVAAP